MQQTIKAFASYGVLARENQPVYSEGVQASDVYDEITIEIPDFIEVSETETGNVYAIDGTSYRFRELIVTTKDGAPAFRWFDSHRNERFVTLKTVG